MPGRLTSWICLGLRTHASRTARPEFERFGFEVDRANESNWVRGQNLPDYDVHLRLP